MADMKLMDENGAGVAFITIVALKIVAGFGWLGVPHDTCYNEILDYYFLHSYNKQITFHFCLYIMLSFLECLIRGLNCASECVPFYIGNPFELDYTL